MVKKCHWKAQRCGPENFTSVLTDFGLCYTFNPGTPDHPLLKVHRAGVDFGLRLQLNVQQDQYYGILRDSSGFKVMIHDQDEPPLINELGFAIHPGMHTFCGIRKTKVLVNLSGFLNVEYTTNLCIAMNLVALTTLKKRA